MPSIRIDVLVKRPCRDRGLGAWARLGMGPINDLLCSYCVLTPRNGQCPLQADFVNIDRT